MKTNLIKLIILVFTFSIISCDNEDYPEVEFNNKQEVVTDTLEYLKERFNLDIRKATSEEAENTISMSYDEFIKLLEFRDSTPIISRADEENGRGSYTYNGSELTIEGTANFQNVTTLSLDLKYRVYVTSTIYSAYSVTPISIKVKNDQNQWISATSVSANFSNLMGVLNITSRFHLNISLNINGSVYMITNWGSIELKCSGSTHGGTVGINFIF